MTTLIGIRYVGKKTRPQPDTVAGTRLVWNDSDEIHYVSEAAAIRLLAHPGVWAEAGRKSEKDETKAAAAPKKQEIDQPPLVSLDTMPKAQLIEFAQRQFGQKLAPQMSEANMRTRIRNWMNSPVMAG